MLDAVRNLHALGVPLAAALRAATEAPARMARRPDLGRIAPGARADLVVLDESLELDRSSAVASRRSEAPRGYLPSRSQTAVGLHAAELGEELAGRGGDVQGRGDPAGAVGGRGGELDVAGEVAGVAEDRPAPGLVAEEGEAGGVLAGAGRARFAADPPVHLLFLLGAVEVLEAEVGADEGVQVLRGRDDPARGPGARGAEEFGDVLRALGFRSRAGSRG